MSHDVPDVHVDQTWNVVYEGILPAFDGVAGSLTTTDNYATMTLSMPTAFFCARGVEDQRLGLQRLAAMTVDDNANQLLHPTDGSFIPAAFRAQRVRRLRCSLQMICSVRPDAAAGQTLPTDDVWWHEDQASLEHRREQIARVERRRDPTRSRRQRQNVCIAKFSAYRIRSKIRSAIFPILEAYDDHLVLGRYDYFGSDEPADQRSRGHCARAIRAFAEELRGSRSVAFTTKRTFTFAPARGVGRARPGERVSASTSFPIRTTRTRAFNRVTRSSMLA